MRYNVYRKRKDAKPSAFQKQEKTTKKKEPFPAGKNREKAGTMYDYTEAEGSIKIRNGRMTLNFKGQNCGFTTAMQAAADFLKTERKIACIEGKGYEECIVYKDKIYVFASWRHFNCNIYNIKLKEAETIGEAE